MENPQVPNLHTEPFDITIEIKIFLTKTDASLMILRFILGDYLIGCINDVGCRLHCAVLFVPGDFHRKKLRLLWIHMTALQGVLKMHVWYAYPDT